MTLQEKLWEREENGMAYWRCLTTNLGCHPLKIVFKDEGDRYLDTHSPERIYFQQLTLKINDQRKQFREKNRLRQENEGEKMKSNKNRH